MTPYAAQASFPWHVAVLIPAQNEEALLSRCLASVLEAKRLLPSHVSTDLIVVSDGSTDQTEAIARRWLKHHGCVSRIEASCVGAARATAARLALQRYAGDPARCWLANTDADCFVPRDWLALQLTAAERGVAAMAGVVDVDDFSEHQPCVSGLFRSTYLIHADGTHPHVHGANLGVRGDVYLGAGGWAPQVTGEDHDLWRRLGRRSPDRCIADARLCVWTSGRRTGRAPMGFAGALAAHNKAQP